MRRSIVVLLAVGACRFEGSGASLDGDGGDDARVEVDPDATADARELDAPADRDGDGVIDAIDRCPDLPDPEQRNEDGDLAGDVCDVCPHLADEQLDRGEVNAGLAADGVGDACDPRPDQAGDRLLLFDGFHGDALAARWVRSQGVTIAADAMRLPDVPASYLVAYTLTDLAATEHVAVAIGVTVRAVAPAGGASPYRYLGVSSQVDAMNGYYCDVVDDVTNAAPGILQLARVAAGAATYTPTTLTGALAPGTGVISGGDRASPAGTGDVATCATTMLGNGSVSIADREPRRARAISVRAYGVDVDVRWIVAIASP